ncbi:MULTISPECIES: Ig-like domain-containing protein [Brevibacillus]|uniref:Ig-like domain-containing protein n=1 Tax=Brevibacillus TaxID=55080 RepID=UPI00245729DF|nr:MULTISPECIES: Ig-like domain-containing protein [Brevibacillus]MDH4619960.1 Ig-like domain-containing protein [Brevibacillus sp. AY1]MED1951819.1 Ig-like domain-containing protein [Brevibacillus centrosporus]
MVNIFQSNPDDYQYILDTLGQDVLINNQPVKAIFSNSTLSTDVDDKKISTLTAISRGDIVHYNNEDWIILSEVNGQRNGRYRAYMRVSDYSIKFNFQGMVKAFPTIVDGKVFDVETGQYMTLPNSKILVTLQESQETLLITVGQRFIKMGRAWAVEGIDRTQKGLLILWCKQDQFNEAVDDIENEIADAGSYVYALDITNTDTTIQKDSTLELNVSVTLNGQVVTDKTVVFSSSDSNIATVDENGLITARNTGSVTITAQLADKTEVKDTILLTVEEIPASFSVTITSTNSIPTEIKNGQSKTYNAEVRVGSTLITDGSQPVTWSLYADNQSSTTTLATVTSQSGTSCTVKNNNANSGYVQLKATLNSDPSVFSWYRIQMKSLI